MRVTYFFSIIAVIFTVQFAPAVALGQVQGSAINSSNATERLAQENLENFRQWRESIPDLEKRLYDRIKKINSRTVDIQRVVLIGMLLLLILNGIILFLVFRRPLGTIALSDTAKTETENGEMNKRSIREKISHERKFIQSIIQQIDRTRLKNLTKRQKKLLNTVEELEAFLASTDGSTKELEELMNEISGWVSKVQKDVNDEISQQGKKIEG